MELGQDVWEHLRLHLTLQCTEVYISKVRKIFAGFNEIKNALQHISSVSDLKTSWSSYKSGYLCSHILHRVIWVENILAILWQTERYKFTLHNAELVIYLLCDLLDKFIVFRVVNIFERRHLTTIMRVGNVYVYVFCIYRTHYAHHTTSSEIVHSDNLMILICLNVLVNDTLFNFDLAQWLVILLSSFFLYDLRI